MRKALQILALLLLPFFSFTKVIAQFDENQSSRPAHDYGSSKFNGGFGFGLDYGGGLGVKISFLPTNWLAVFGSLGLYYYETGYSAGLQFKLPSEKKISCYLTGMYGANGGLETEVEITRKQYYGATVGGGIEIKTKKDIFFWNLELTMPFRDDQLKKDVDEFKSQGLTVTSTTWPVNFSVGLHVKFP